MASWCGNDVGRTLSCRLTAGCRYGWKVEWQGGKLLPNYRGRAGRLWRLARRQLCPLSGRGLANRGGAAEPFRAAIMPDTGLPEVRIITSDCFVESAEHGNRLHKALSGDIVDMETAAVAQAAARMDVPWAAIKATSDDANGDSAGDFQANLKRAARLAADAAERMIAQLPRG